MHRLLRLIAVVLLCSVFVFDATKVTALSAEQSLVYERGIYAYDVAIGVECGSAGLPQQVFQAERQQAPGAAAYSLLTSLSSSLLKL